MEERINEPMEQDKKVKLLKEIEDIRHEQERIKSLLRDNKLQELNNYLQGELTQKHFIEKALHNMVNPNIPVTVEGNANNAFDFLEALKREKEAELAKETLESDS